ncbi:MAG: DUF4394 domain-containing protein [Phycisphaerae bacterium]
MSFTRMNCALAAAAALGITGAASAELAYGTTQGGFLVSFDTATPGTIISGTPVQGLLSNEQLVGIDFRPATGELYGIGSFSRIYRINPMSGQVNPVGPQFAPALNGASFGMDFNPTVDRIRQVSDADQNQRYNPITGLTAATDASLFYGAGDANQGVNPNVSHVAYTNSVPNATSTTLFGLDTGTDTLVRHTVGPAFATLTTVGSMGTDITDVGGFDISGFTGTAFAAIRDVNQSRTTFWTLNLGTGLGSQIGEIGGGHILTSLSIVPEPTSIALLALGGLALAARRR